ncbi:MAG: hypothetical protein HC811_03755 [Flammeovirgaceae bacterium]|nr:hypothetical protein [Flammeovirgaceae bacterium]
MLIRRKRVAEVMTWIFIAGTISTSYLSRYQKINSVDYSDYFSPPSKLEGQIQDKRIMILGEDWSLYTINTPRFRIHQLETGGANFQ